MLLDPFPIEEGLDYSSIAGHSHGYLQFGRGKFALVDKLPTYYIYRNVLRICADAWPQQVKCQAGDLRRRGAGDGCGVSLTPAAPVRMPARIGIIVKGPRAVCGVR